MTVQAIPFVDLRLREDAGDIAAAIERVIARGWFVLGPEVETFEAEFAQAAGARCAVGVGTGTDAIMLVLRALGIGPGDEVITTPVSAAYTALAIMMTGARPVFADVDPERLTIDPAAVAALVTPRTAAVVPVHLYGQPADMQALEAVAARHHLAIVEDACQAHLATAAGRPVGTIGIAGAFSFYPTKNLGALGDGGGVVTNDPELAQRLKRLRNGGQDSRYHHREPGVNTRLDEIQAAILRARLRRLAGWTATRRALATGYRQQLVDTPVQVPREFDAGHVYHLFPVRSRQREEIRAHLDGLGIGTLVHYPIPIPRQPALEGTRPGECPVADVVCDEVFSLPLHPALQLSDVARVADAVRSFRSDRSTSDVGSPCG